VASVSERNVNCELEEDDGWPYPDDVTSAVLETGVVLGFKDEPVESVVAVASMTVLETTVLGLGAA
jgi:hypothetical protein